MFNLGFKDGPAISDLKGKVLSCANIDDSLHEILNDIWSSTPEMFPDHIKKAEELRDRFQQLEYRVTQLSSQLDPEEDNSWLNQQNNRWENNRAELSKITVSMADMKASNELDHQRLAQEARQAISQITVDGQFLEHARELIRFFKTA